MKLSNIYKSFALGVTVAAVISGCGGGGATNPFTLSSTSIDSGGVIDVKYAWFAEDNNNAPNISPQLEWENVPDGTNSFAFIMDDPDAVAVVGRVWVHWNIFIPEGNVTSIPENASLTVNMPAGSVEGTSDGGAPHYEGPNPPAGAAHTYKFCLYALSTAGIPAGVDASSKYTQDEFKAKFDADILGSNCFSASYTHQ